MNPHVHADNEDYRRHLAEVNSPEGRALSARVQNTFASPAGEHGQASDDDLDAYVRWEMREAMFWLSPCVSRSNEDGFHASCCIMRADAALRVLAKRRAIAARCDAEQSRPRSR